MKYLAQGISEFQSTITEDWSEWSETTTYSIEDEEQPGGLTDISVARVGNYYYRTITNDNLGFNPEEYLGIKWIRWAVSNPHAMFDLQATTRSYATTIPDYTTDGSAQVQDILIDDIVLYEVASGTTGAGVIDTYYRALIDQAGLDLDAEDFTNIAKWLPTGTDIIIEFPKGTSDTIAIGYYTADRTTIQNLGLPYVGPPAGGEEEVDWVIDLDGFYRDILAVQSYQQSPNDDVEDYYSYIYSAYTTEVDRTKMFNITSIGTMIRIVFTPETITQETSVGFLVANESTSMGDTLYGIDFSFNSFSLKETDVFGAITITKRGIQDLVDFETVISSNEIERMKRRIRSIHDEVIVFILDPSETSVYENFITLGTVENVSTILDNNVLTTIAWSIHETI